MVGFNVNEFRSEITKKGILKNNKFLVRMYAPRGFNSSLSNTVRFLEFWCESANIPGVSLSATEVRRYGYGNIEKKPYVTMNNDVTMSFLGDAQGIIWTFFQQWIKLIVNYDMRNGITGSTGVTSGQAPFELSYKEDYAVDIHLSIFDDLGNEAIHVLLREAYPIFVGDIQLNWGDTNSIMRIPVTFAVYDWYNENFSQNSATGPSQPTTAPIQVTQNSINNQIGRTASAVTSLIAGTFSPLRAAANFIT